MPQTGLITPSNIGIVTRPCTDVQQQQNLSNIANNLVNLQTQIGDPSTLPPLLAQIPGLDGLPGGPGGPGTPGTDGPAGTSGIDLTSLIRQILQTIQTIIDTMPTPGGSGLPGYGGLYIGSTQNIPSSGSGAGTVTVVPFDTAMPTLAVTATTGSGAKLTVGAAGDYLVTFSLTGQPVNVTNSKVVFNNKLVSFVKKNGSTILTQSVAGSSTQTYNLNADTVRGENMNVSGCAILTLANNDYLQLMGDPRRGLNGAGTDMITLNTAANTAKTTLTTELANITCDLLAGQLNVLRLA